MTAFHNSLRSNGKRYWAHTCAECLKPLARARKRRWYYKDPVRARQDSSDWYRNNRERAIESMNAYRIAHRDERRVYMREYMRKRRQAEREAANA